MTTLRINDNGIEREMTAEETATHNAWAKIETANIEAQKSAELERANIRAVALKKLGLTADEIAALFG